MELLKKHGFKPVFIESEGAHTWLNWRDYLSAFAPQLFQPQRSSTSAGGGNVKTRKHEDTKHEGPKKNMFLLLRVFASFGVFVPLEHEPNLHRHVTHGLRARGGAEPRGPRCESRRIQRAIR